ncbi:MAG TPA: Ig-like domain-containing protein [Bacillota bacterium]|nr:Ig-like domain-containing protein [Bacillota bacterium]
MQEFRVTHFPNRASITHTEGKPYLLKGVFTPDYLNAVFDRMVELPTVDTDSTYPRYTSGYYAVRTFNASAEVDWVFVRVYTPVEPVVTVPTIASEMFYDDFSSAASLADYTQRLRSFDIAAKWYVDPVSQNLTAVGGKQAVLTRNGFSASDVDLTANMTQATNAGMVARFKDSDNYYVMTISDDSGSNPTYNLKFYKRINGTFTPLPEADVNWVSGTPATVRMVVYGNNLLAYFNNTQVISFTDSSITGSGLVGLRNFSSTGYGTGIFNDFRVTDLSAVAPAPPAGVQSFSDSFTSGNLNAYTQYSDYAANWTTDPIAGTVTGSRIATPPSAEQSILTRNGFSAENVDVTVNLLQGDYAGIAARFKDNSNYYLITFRDDTASMSYNLGFNKRVGGLFTSFGAADLPFVRGVTATVRLTVYGNTLEVYFNGRKVASAVDDSITGPGKVGIRFGAGQPTVVQDFRALELTSPPSNINVNSTFNSVQVFDTFSVDSLSSYTQYATTNGTWTIDTGTGTINISDGSSSKLIRNGISLENVDITATVTSAQTGGLAARFKDKDTNYMLVMRDDTSNATNNLEIIKYLPGSYTGLGNVDVSWARGKTATVRFVVYGSTLEAFFNGKKVISVVDTAISGTGGVGLRNNGSGPLVIQDWQVKEIDRPQPDLAIWPTWYDHFLNSGVNNYKEYADTPATSWVIDGANTKLTATAGTQAVFTKQGFYATDVDMQSGMSANNGGLVARFKDNNNYYVLCAGDDAGALQTTLGWNLGIYKRVSGTFSKLASADVTWAAGTQQMVRFTVVGNTLEAYYNGVRVITAVDTSITGAGMVGLRNNNAAPATYDDLLAIDLNALSAETFTGQTLVNDTFSDDSISGYTQSSDTPGTWQVSPGSGILTGTGGQQSVLLRKDLSLRDVELTTNMSAPCGGLVARFVDNNNHYLLGLSDDSYSNPNANFRLMTRINGTYTRLATANVNWPVGGMAQIRFVVKGSKLEAYFNGQRVINITDTTFSNPGPVGVRNDTAIAQYADFLVKDLSAATPAYTAKALGTFTSNVLDISEVVTAGKSTLTLDTTGSQGTGFALETNLSLDGGVTWKGWKATPNGGLIPGAEMGTNLSNARLKYRVTMAAADTWAWNKVGTIYLGMATGIPTGTYAAVQNPVVASAVYAGNGYTVIIKPDGTAWAWGDNTYGVLGQNDQDLSDNAIPVQVQGLTGIVGIGTGAYHVVALKNDGTVWTWGLNADLDLGQLGRDSSISPFMPVQVSGISNVKSIAAGLYHTLALKDDGTVWAWGANTNNQLGIDDTNIDFTNIPAQVVDANDLTDGKLHNVVNVDAGAFHSIALKADGTVVTWGDNSQGQGGSGALLPDYNSVTAVPGLSNVVAISAGDSFNLALKSDGNISAWGANGNGQLGAGVGGNYGSFSADLVSVSYDTMPPSIVAAQTTNQIPETNLINTVPVAEAVYVTRKAPITITFNEPIDALTVKSDTFVVADAVYGIAIPGTVTPGGDSVTFTPTNPYDLGIRYKVILKPGIQDLVGNVVYSSTIWYFTATPDINGPQCSIAINDDQDKTNSRIVTLKVNSDDDSGVVSHMQFSNDGVNWGYWEKVDQINYKPDITWDFWGSYVQSPKSVRWMLSDEDTVTKTVYVRFADPSGNQSGIYSDTINLHTTAPRITGSNINEAVSMSVYDNLILNFDENILPGGTIGGITVSPLNGNNVHYSWNVTGNVLTIDPASDFNYNTLYSVTIPATAIMDEYGNNMVQDYVYSFMVGPDTLGPTARAIPFGGDYAEAQSVILEPVNEPGPISIYYSTDGSAPSVGGSSLYSMPINISATTTLKFIAVDATGNVSGVFTEQYNLDPTGPKSIGSTSTAPVVFANKVAYVHDGLREYDVRNGQETSLTSANYNLVMRDLDPANGRVVYGYSIAPFGPEAEKGLMVYDMVYGQVTTAVYGNGATDNQGAIYGNKLVYYNSVTGTMRLKDLSNNEESDLLNGQPRLLCPIKLS